MTAPSFAFTLEADPTTPAATTAAATRSVALAARPAVKQGLLRPFRLDGKGGFARVSGDALLDEKLGNLLSLDGLPWAPERTAHLDSLRHMNAGPARVFARAYIADAAARYLPELRVEEVTATDQKNGTVRVEVVASPVRDPAQTAIAGRVLR